MLIFTVACIVALIFVGYVFCIYLTEKLEEQESKVVHLTKQEIDYCKNDVESLKEVAEQQKRNEMYDLFYKVDGTPRKQETVSEHYAKKDDSNYPDWYRDMT